MLIRQHNHTIANALPFIPSLYKVSDVQATTVIQPEWEKTGQRINVLPVCLGISSISILPIPLQLKER